MASDPKAIYIKHLESAIADLRDALTDALAHVEELREAWMRGTLREHDGKSGTRSNRNVDVEWLDALPNRDEQLQHLRSLVVRSNYPLACWCCCWDGVSEPAPQCHAVVLAKILMEMEPPAELKGTP